MRSNLIFSRGTLRGGAAILSAGLVGAFAASVDAGPHPRVIFSNIATSPTSLIPDGEGLRFNPGTATQFDRPFVSPDGSQWIFAAIADALPADLDIIVVGGGTTSAGAQTVLREADATFFDGAIVYSSFGTSLGINNNGHYVFTADTSAATTVDAIAAKWDGTMFELMAREGTQAPGQGAGVGYGSTIDSVHILNNGMVYLRTAALTGATTQQVIYELTDIATGAVLAQTDVTVPTGQLVAPDQSIDVLNTNRFRIDPQGNTIYVCDLNGPTTSDLVAVVNNAVIAQEGQVLPGGLLAPATVTLFTGDAGAQQVGHNGDYLIRGSVSDTRDYVLGNNGLAAVTDDPIYPGASLLYDDTAFANTYFINTLNAYNEPVIGGLTNSGDVNSDALLVYNNESVLVREHDPIDLDGDGVAADNARVSVFNNDDSFMTRSHYYFFADLRDDALVSIGQAFLVIPLPRKGDMNCDGVVNNFDIDPFVQALTDPAGYEAANPDCRIDNADVDGDGMVNNFDIDPFVALLTGP
ncbi:MAG: hypothetical protein AB7Q17_17720 [Phycisphaerae bacterium]